ncbi:hypothetical protein CYMTET_12125 [Cymbomonas tetramitiformis]|uniref:Uncharacterized protein n=1 Tax=Cymbomonas tetramitiformis TaxID=36881 RepID=A0AAE0GKN7_9CHLO|nr:hypothetical protein CYMTET_12125 [Cymbomonas tetramitiformis]
MAIRTAESEAESSQHSSNSLLHPQNVDSDWGDEDLVVSDDDGESSSENDEWDVCAVPRIFTTEGVRRLFKVEKTLRVGGNHRPSFEYFGCVVEVPLSWDVSKALADLSDDKLVERDLTLSLRYEPPSPKFKRQCPHYTSYRLKVSRGTDFIYSTRGMDKQLTCNRRAMVAVWGNLEIAFKEDIDLSTFLAALKYVEVSELKAIPERTNQDTTPTLPPPGVVPSQPRTAWAEQLWPTTPRARGMAIAVVVACLAAAVVTVPRRVFRFP